MTTPHHPLTVGSRFGPYRLDRLIGRGGMGEVYQAYDTVKERTVAIKVLPERMAQDPVYRQRFQRESHAAARLREAHVIPIHDYGEIDGHLFIDMRLVDGESLRELLRRSGCISAERTVEIIGQMAEALDAAHADGLLHRDVKPDNILITRTGFAYLVDFGIAQSATDSALTGDGSAVGSFGYMAPERFSSRELTPAADVYALTCVLFECLTGTRPFIGDTDAQIMRAHLFDPVPRPSLVRRTVSAAFDSVVAQGMAKNPAERCASAGGLAAAARAALSAPAEAGEVTLGDETRTTAPVVDPAGAATPAATPDARDETGPPADTGPATNPRRWPPPRRLAILTAVITLVVALGFTGWALAQPLRAGNAVPDASALTKDDVDLLGFTQRPAFNRANCVHEEPDEYSIAILSCGINYDAGNPGVRLWRFHNADRLHEFYASVLDVTQLTACPGDPPGQDAPSTRDGKEVGRRGCYTNTKIGPAPKPAFIITNEEIPAMAMYLWDDVADQPIRDWEARREDWQFRAADNVRDPDDFSPTDRAIFANVGREWQAGNCRHTELPPGSAANASVECVNANGYPLSAFIGFTDRTKATLLYQQDLTLLKGHACGGGEQPDGVWRQKGKLVGRFYCYADPREIGRQCILSLPDEFHTAGIFCTLPQADPHLGPKDEQQLLDWFLRKLG